MLTISFNMPKIIVRLFQFSIKKMISKLCTVNYRISGQRKGFFIGILSYIFLNYFKVYLTATSECFYFLQFLHVQILYMLNLKQMWSKSLSHMSVGCLLKVKSIVTISQKKSVQKPYSRAESTSQWRIATQQLNFYVYGLSTFIKFLYLSVY